MGRRAKGADCQVNGVGALRHLNAERELAPTEAIASVPVVNEGAQHAFSKSQLKQQISAIKHAAECVTQAFDKVEAAFRIRFVCCKRVEHESEDQG